MFLHARLIAIAMVALSVLSGPALAAAEPTIIYNKQKDELAVTASEVPLSKVLAEVSRLTGIEVLMDPGVDRPVTAAFKALPMKDAVARLTSKTNTMSELKAVGDGKQKRTVLVKLIVLPEGKTDITTAVRLVKMDTELDYRAGQMSQYAQKAQGQYDLMIERWKARMPGLTAEQRKRYDDRAKFHQARVAAQAERDQAREKVRAERQKQKEAEYAEKLGDRRPVRKEPDPALRAKARQQFQQPETEGLVEEP